MSPARRPPQLMTAPVAKTARTANPLTWFLSLPRYSVILIVVRSDGAGWTLKPARGSSAAPPINTLTIPASIAFACARPSAVPQQASGAALLHRPDRIPDRAADLLTHRRR